VLAESRKEQARLEVVAQQVGTEADDQDWDPRDAQHRRARAIINRLYLNPDDTLPVEDRPMLQQLSVMLQHQLSIPFPIQPLREVRGGRVEEAAAAANAAVAACSSEEVAGGGNHLGRTLSPDPAEVAASAAKKKLRWSGMPAPGNPHDYDDTLPWRAPVAGETQEQDDDSMSRPRAQSPKPDSDGEE
jgi:hypothetical protein